MPDIKIPKSKWNEWPGVEPHPCHFCGTYVIHGYESNGTRHYLSDCRPDLVEHEPGELCTWHKSPGEGGCPHELDKLKTPEDLFDHMKNCVKGCYANQNRDTHKWDDNHIHFDTDGPM